MVYPNIPNITLNKDKRIGDVLFIAEGEKTEPNLIFTVFCKVFGYTMHRLYRNKKHKVFNRSDDQYSRIIFINAEDSDIKRIARDNEYLNHMFELLINEYNLDIDNAAIYYVFDRDHKSNTDLEFIRYLLENLACARDTNPDFGRQGLLLMSYPCIESFVGMCFMDDCLGFCIENEIEICKALRKHLSHKKLQSNKVDETALINCSDEMIRSLSAYGIDVDTSALINSLDNFFSNNLKIFNEEERVFHENSAYGMLSLFTLALLDLGLIELSN